MYLRYVQHGLWLKAHVKYYFSLFFSSSHMFIYSVNETALRFTSTYLLNKCGASKHSFSKGQSSGENVCGMAIKLLKIFFLVTLSTTFEFAQNTETNAQFF